MRHALFISLFYRNGHSQEGVAVKEVLANSTISVDHQLRIAALLMEDHGQQSAVSEFLSDASELTFGAG